MAEPRLAVSDISQRRTHAEKAMPEQHVGSLRRRKRVASGNEARCSVTHEAGALWPVWSQSVLHRSVIGALHSELTGTSLAALHTLSFTQRMAALNIEPQARISLAELGDADVQSCRIGAMNSRRHLVAWRNKELFQ